MGKKSFEYSAMMYDPDWDEHNAYWFEPRPGRKLSRVDLVRRELAQAQVAAIMKDRAAFQIEAGMLDDEYITNVVEAFYAPTSREAAAAEAELSERLLMVAQEEGPEAVADLHRAHPALF